MEDKREGAALPPVYLPGRGPVPGRAHGPRPDGLPCEMCGARPIAVRCRRICTRCGFLTGFVQGEM